MFLIHNGAVNNIKSCMKEPDYVIKMMAMGGSPIADDLSHSTTHCWIEGGIQKTKEFTYTLPFPVLSCIG
jgi:hypothetical protein